MCQIICKRARLPQVTGWDLDFTEYSTCSPRKITPHKIWTCEGNIENESLIESIMQVGPGSGYVLSVGGFNADLSTLGDAMVDPKGIKSHDGMKFSAK